MTGDADTRPRQARRSLTRRTEARRLRSTARARIAAAAPRVEDGLTGQSSLVQFWIMVVGGAFISLGLTITVNILAQGSITSAQGAVDALGRGPGVTALPAATALSVLAIFATITVAIALVERSTTSSDPLQLVRSAQRSLALSGAALALGAASTTMAFLHVLSLIFHRPESGVHSAPVYLDAVMVVFASGVIAFVASLTRSHPEDHVVVAAQNLPLHTAIRDVTMAEQRLRWGFSPRERVPWWQQVLAAVIASVYQALLVLALLLVLLAFGEIGDDLLLGLFMAVLIFAGTAVLMGFVPLALSANAFVRWPWTFALWWPRAMVLVVLGVTVYLWVDWPEDRLFVTVCAVFVLLHLAPQCVSAFPRHGSRWRPLVITLLWPLAVLWRSLGSNTYRAQTRSLQRRRRAVERAEAEGAEGAGAQGAVGAAAEAGADRVPG
ncbi:MAG: hypothetical protein Q4G34_06145 [Micrococcus sp.]|nr:hypothetical protein [Micrococcus sp.]